MNLRLPPQWRTLSWHARAAYLCATRQARDFSEACSMLAKLPRKPRARDLRIKAVQEMERRKLW